MVHKLLLAGLISVGLLGSPFAADAAVLAIGISKSSNRVYAWHSDGRCQFMVC
jgi:hypothetical protein